MKKAKTKIISYFIFILALTGSVGAFAERPANVNPYGYISNMGQVVFGQAGGAFMPASVYSSLRSGNISPIMQFVLMNHLMNAAVADVIKRHPLRRDSFVVATAKFRDGLCRIQKAFQQGMLLSFLPQLSSNSSNGGSNNQYMGSMGKYIALAFQNSKGCGSGGGEKGGIDPMLVQMLAAN